MKYFVVGCIFWSIGACAIYAVRPNSILSKETIEIIGSRVHFVIASIMVATILLCTLPMPLSPAYNGENPKYTNQYEVLAESILDGRIDLDYGDMDPLLLEMDNPYDREQRKEVGVHYHWDHAFYNGHYYMYFGVVPVLLLFLPFRVITGTSLTTYHATQIFTALFIFGIFVLFLLLARKFFCKMNLSVYLSLSVSISIMSVWYIVAAPALYCTAIAAGICMEVWSLFFFMKAVWDANGEGQSTVYGVLGSLFGALAFGCRPTIALANILAVPLFIHYLNGKKFNLKLLKQILAVLVPYVIIGLLLMAYNYVRFENPFEFGQSYQLTVADQRGYGNLLSQFGLKKVVNGLMKNFIAYTPYGDSFPYTSFQSVLLNFPICLISLFCLLQKDTLSALRKNKLVGFVGVLLFCPVLITTSQILASPYLLERYRSDIYWLIGILMFLAFGLFLENLNEREKRFGGFIVALLAFATIFRSFILWTVPYDNNFTDIYPGYLATFEKVLRLGFK